MGYQRVRTAIDKRRERVHLKQPVLSESDGQQAIVRWQTVAEPWAAVEALDDRQRESLAALQLTVTQSYHVDIPYRAGVLPSMLVEWRDKTLQIHSVVDDDARRERLILLCSEVQA